TARKEDLARRRRKPAGGPAQQIVPVAPGVAVKYLLSGLVRCHECGRSMRAIPSSPNTRSGGKYVYYACPGSLSGGCPNRTKVREDRLRQVVVARLRDRLFPKPAPLA